MAMIVVIESYSHYIRQHDRNSARSTCEVIIMFNLRDADNLKFDSRSTAWKKQTHDFGNASVT